MQKFTLISELQLEKVRCKIENINKKGEKTYITVFNILGERRMEILEELKLITGDKEQVDVEVFNNFYIGLILEFTDIIMDKEDITFMINEGNLTSKILLQEINDIIYELQFEDAMSNLANARTLTLGMLAENALQEINYAKARLDRENERKEKTIIHKAKKRNRKFIK